MEPEISGFALGLLFGAAKTLAITTLIFGVAWWRARRRVHALEAEVRKPSLDAERLDRLEQTLEYMMGQLDRLGDARGDLGVPTPRQLLGTETTRDSNEESPPKLDKLLRPFRPCGMGPGCFPPQQRPANRPSQDRGSEDAELRRGARARQSTSGSQRTAPSRGTGHRDSGRPRHQAIPRRALIALTSASPRSVSRSTAIAYSRPS